MGCLHLDCVELGLALLYLRDYLEKLISCQVFILRISEKTAPRILFLAGQSISEAAVGLGNGAIHP